MPVLKIIQGERPGARVPLRERLVLGRSTDCDFCINSDQSSREHAEVVRREGGFIVRDLGSRNGTFVNDARITERRLAHGDRIRIAWIVLEYVDPPAGGPEPSAPPAREGIGGRSVALVLLALALLAVVFFLGQAAGRWFIRQGASAPAALEAPKRATEAP